MTTLTPTKKDLSRDLLFDLHIAVNNSPCWASLLGWPAAIRRALAAEALKAWVHGWLDAQGVPADPDPEHTAQTGCRISGRLTWLLGRITVAEAERDTAREVLAEALEHHEALARHIEMLRKQAAGHVEHVAALKGAALTSGQYVNRLEAACGALLDDVARYLDRGGKLTETEAAHVEALRAVLEGRS